MCLPIHAIILFESTEAVGICGGVIAGVIAVILSLIVVINRGKSIVADFFFYWGESQGISLLKQAYAAKLRMLTHCSVYRGPRPTHTGLDSCNIIIIAQKWHP